MISIVFAKAEKGISVYQDDIFNHSVGFARHMKLQQDIYDRMRNHCLVFKMSKARLNYPMMKILGHIISAGGRAPNPEKIQAIIDLAPPTTPKGIRELVGMSQYNAEYIHGLSSILAPLNDIMHDDCDVKTQWNDSTHGEAFRILKTRFMNAPLLAMPEVFKEFRIFVDTCTTHGRGIGAILTQWHGEGELDPMSLDVSGKGWRPVAYWSKLLNKSQRKYSATEAEAKGLHDSILHWAPYLKIGQFSVVVDHKALEYIFNSPNITANRRILHYALDLQGFNYKVLYKDGKSHLNADGLSRLYRYEDKLDDEQEENITYDTVTADDVRILSEKMELDETYLQTLITKHDQDEVHTVQWANFASAEAERKAKGDFCTIINEKQATRLLALSTKRATFTDEQMHCMRMNQAMYNDVEFMAGKDNFDDDYDEDEEDPYIHYDRLKPPLEELDLYRSGLDTYLMMHKAEGASQPYADVRDIKHNNDLESSYQSLYDIKDINFAQLYCRETNSNTECEKSCCKPQFRLARLTEGDIPYTDPMSVDYVNLDHPNIFNEDDDSRATHRRVHNLLDGSVKYESLHEALMLSEEVEESTENDPPSGRMVLRKKNLRHNSRDVIQGKVVTDEYGYAPRSKRDIDRINNRYDEIERNQAKAGQPRPPKSQLNRTSVLPSSSSSSSLSLIHI